MSQATAGYGVEALSTIDRRTPRTVASRVVSEERPVWIGRIAFIGLMFAVVPSVLGVSLSSSLGNGGTLRITDVVFPAVGAITLPASARIRGFWVVLLLGWFCVFLAVVGVYNGASTRWIGRDVRAPLYLAITFSVCLYLFTDTRNHRWLAGCTVWILGVVAVLVVLSQISPVALVGQSQDDALYYGTTVTQLSSRRAQIETDALALVLLGGFVGAYVAGGKLENLLDRRRILVLVTSCFTILFVSYSRNTLLGLTASILVALVAPIGLRGRPQVAAKLNGLILSFSKAWLLLVALAPAVIVILATGIFHSEIATYQTRVIGGLSSQSLATDSSVAWRSVESHLALSAFNAHPIIGDGIGSFYRPLVVGEPFTGDNGRVYMHNFYLWVLVRGGVIYACILAVVLGGALLRLLLLRVDSPTERDLRLVAACGLAALLAVAYVAPWPEQTDGAPVLGALLALGWLPPLSRSIGAHLPPRGASSPRAKAS